MKAARLKQSDSGTTDYLEHLPSLFLKSNTAQFCETAFLMKRLHQKKLCNTQGIAVEIFSIKVVVAFDFCIRPLGPR